MPVHYNISPDLKLVIYLCSGLVSGADIFETSEKVIRDKRRISGLITIIDFLDAVENIQSGELHEAIKRMESLAERGVVIGSVVILSQSRGMQVLVDTINLLPHKVPFKLDMVYTIEEAISLLGLSEIQDDIIQFWNETKSPSA